MCAMTAIIALSVRPLLMRCQSIGLIAINRHLSMKYLRDKQMIKESKLQTIQELVLKKNVETNGNIDWNQLVAELTEQRLVFRHNFEIDLMSAFLLNNGTDCQKVDQKLFTSLSGFIKVLPNVVNNSIASSRFCHFISHFNHFIDSSHIELIRETSDDLLHKYNNNQITHPVMSDCIIGLTQSSPDNCLHAIQLLDSLKTVDYNLINRIIDSCIRFRLFEQSFDLMRRFSDMNVDKQLMPKIIASLNDSQLNLDQTLNILQILSNKLIVFDMDLIAKFNELMERLSYKRFETSIGRKGLCLKCNQTLRRLSPEEQRILLKEFRSVIFSKENDILMASLPEYEKELQNFEKFMRKMTAKKPLDLVIDGLNIAFSTFSDVVEDKNNLRQFVQTFSKENIDTNVVEMLIKHEVFTKYENILIVGRKHMKNWPKLNQMLWTQRERISMFYAMNKTQDDCYILYAALHNPNTAIISSDFYRDYLARIDTKSNQFERWLRTHQILVKERKFFEYPDQFDHKIHISDDKRIIHIPFENGNNLSIKWICYQKM